MNCKQDKIVFKRRLFCWTFKIKYKIKDNIQEIELEYGIADLKKCAIRHSTFAEKKDFVSFRGNFGYAHARNFEAGNFHRHF